MPIRLLLLLVMVVAAKGSRTKPPRHAQLLCPWAPNVVSLAGQGRHHRVPPSGGSPHVRRRSYVSGGQGAQPPLRVWLVFW